MKVGNKYESVKQDPTQPVPVYTVEMFNESVVCLHTFKEGGIKNYSLVRREGFEDEFIPVMPLKKKAKYDGQSFEKAAKPMIEWLNNNCNPHAKVIIDCSWAELLMGEMSIKNEEFIKG